MSNSPKKNRSNKRKKKRRAGDTFRQILRPALPLAPFIALAVVTLCAYTWLYTDINIKAIPITTLKEQQRELKEQIDAIKLQIEMLQAPGRIESIAQEKLGMILPEEYRVVVLDEPMWPPGIAEQAQPNAQKRMQAKKESEGLFGFLGAASFRPTGSLSERGEKAQDAPLKTASERSVRQPG